MTLCDAKIHSSQRDIIVMNTLTTPLTSNIPHVSWAQNSRGLRVWEFGETQNEDKVSMFCPQLSGGTDSPKRPCFLFEPELTSNTERRKWHSKKQEGPRKSIISFFVLLPWVSQPLKLKVVTEKERENRAIHVFAFAFTLTHQ